MVAIRCYHSIIRMKMLPLITIQNIRRNSINIYQHWTNKPNKSSPQINNDTKRTMTHIVRIRHSEWTILFWSRHSIIDTSSMFDTKYHARLHNNFHPQRSRYNTSRNQHYLDKLQVMCYFQSLNAFINPQNSLQRALYNSSYVEQDGLIE